LIAKSLVFRRKNIILYHKNVCILKEKIFKTFVKNLSNLCEYYSGYKWFLIGHIIPLFWFTSDFSNVRRSKESGCNERCSSIGF
jgi:hypothetical protein